ncbi:MAG: CBS domain-containing protein [Flavonifractor plautii]
MKDLDFDRPPCLDASVTMDRAWKLMREQKISAIPVVNEDGSCTVCCPPGDIATFSLNTVGEPVWRPSPCSTC